MGDDPLHFDPPYYDNNCDPEYDDSSWGREEPIVDRFSLKDVKILIREYIGELEDKYSKNAFQISDGENQSLKMYLQIKDHPMVKKYVLVQAIKDVAVDFPEINGLILIEARYDIEREDGIKK